MPGLLQTPDYTSALLPRLRPPGEWTADDVEEAVTLRAARQVRLLAGDMRYGAVIDEAAFRRPVGSSSTMHAQVLRVIELAGLPTVTIQVIPFDAGPHPGQEGSFQHARLGVNLGDVVFVEGLLGSFLIEDVDHVQHYAKIYDYLAVDVALSPAGSLAWLKKELRRWQG
jgi:hypothetical protein